MYTGITGKVKIGDNDVAYISNWSVEDSMEVIEVSRLGERYKDKRAGQGNWTASADGTVVFGNDGKSHEAIFTAMHSGSPVECEFYLDSNEDKPVKFSGNGLIETLSVDLSAEDKGNISISISGVGELTFPGKE
ncbi:MAG: phage tail tube protein [Clostridiales bacterium]|jgi:predicted secreted protein|nr:phage tail tube protein [Clostridiales bacterium]